MTDIGIHAPHGVEMTGTHDPVESMQAPERQAFHSLLHPPDIYTTEGVYWADLPLKERIAFVLKFDAEEFGREFKYFWEMFKNDPLQPMRYYFKNLVLPGAGLGLEG